MTTVGLVTALPGHDECPASSSQTQRGANTRWPIFQSPEVLCTSRSIGGPLFRLKASSVSCKCQRRHQQPDSQLQNSYVCTRGLGNCGVWLVTTRPRKRSLARERSAHHHMTLESHSSTLGLSPAI